MKRFIFVSIFFFAAVFFYGQNSSVNQTKAPGMYLPDGSKLDEYKKTFEIENISHPDPVTLSKIDMSKYWKLMRPNQRVEVLDGETGLTLILYSRDEINTILDFNSLLIVMPTDSGRDETKKGD